MLHLYINYINNVNRMNVLVTGANGLLGHHVVMELLKRKHTVNILVRSTKSIHFDLASVNVFIGTFTDYRSLANAAQHCNAIIHIAAVTATNLLHYTDYESVNVQGSALVIKVANDLNIQNIVYVSTANTIGYGSEKNVADENCPIQFPFTNSYYAQSKLASEQLFIQASKQLNSHIIIIHPTFMIGAYDTKPSSGKLIIMGYKRWLNFVPKGGKNFVPVTDVALVICNALVTHKNGEHYLVSGENLSFKTYYELQKKQANYKQLNIEIPNLLLKVIGKIGDIVRFLGIRTEICSMNLNQLIIREFYTNQKAKNELDLSPTDLKISIDEAISWFKANKMI